MPTNVFDPYPKLKAVARAIATHPAVVARYATDVAAT
jgi:hypothetical protein